MVLAWLSRGCYDLACSLSPSLCAIFSALRGRSPLSLSHFKRNVLLVPNEGPIRDRMVFQERRVHRLREQVESMMEANRRCDVMRRRQEAFLGHLIEKYQGDNVPLTADLCRRYCSLFEVSQAGSRRFIYLPFTLPDFFLLLYEWRC